MIELIQACAPSTPVPIAQAIIQTESGFNPFAIGVNKGGKQVAPPKSYNEAVLQAKMLISTGYNIDLGLAQINSANLKWLGLSVEQVLQPCNNLKAMQFILSNCYQKSGSVGHGTKMQRAFSCYNTGNHKNGFYNNYVNKVTRNYNRFSGSSSQKYTASSNQTYTASNNAVSNQKQYINLPRNSNELASYANQVNDQHNANKIVKKVDLNEDINNNDVVVEQAYYSANKGKDNSVKDVFESSKKDAFAF